MCFLTSPNIDIKVPTIRIIRNICAGTSEQIDHVIKGGGIINQFY